MGFQRCTPRRETSQSFTFTPGLPRLCESGLGFAHAAAIHKGATFPDHARVCWRGRSRSSTWRARLSPSLPFPALAPHLSEQPLMGPLVHDGDALGERAEQARHLRGTRDHGQRIQSSQEAAALGVRRRKQGGQEESWLLESTLNPQRFPWSDRVSDAVLHFSSLCRTEPQGDHLRTHMTIRPHLLYMDASPPELL